MDRLARSLVLTVAVTSTDPCFLTTTGFGLTSIDRIFGSGAYAGSSSAKAGAAVTSAAAPMATATSVVATRFTMRCFLSPCIPNTPRGGACLRHRRVRGEKSCVNSGEQWSQNYNCHFPDGPSALPKWTFRHLWAFFGTNVGSVMRGAGVFGAPRPLSRRAQAGAEPAVPPRDGPAQRPPFARSPRAVRHGHPLPGEGTVVHPPDG